MKGRIAIGVAAMTASLACGSPSEPTGVELSQTWSGLELPALFESEDLCVAWTLDNEDSLFVNAVSMTNSGGFHHSNWFFVPDEMYAGPDEMFDCGDRNFDSLNAALAGGVVAAWSTQATAETQAFGTGTVYEIPPHSRIVANLHVLNASDQALTTDFSLTLQTLPVEQVEVRLSPMMLDYQALAIPPHARSRFTMACDFETPYGRPLDFSFYYLLPHYHALGAGSRFEGIDTAGAASMIYEQSAGIGEVLSISLDPPVSGDGLADLQFGCDFVNDRDDTVGAGIGDQEMCILVAWTDSEYMWIGFATEASTQVGQDGETQLFESPCRVTFVQN